jgi:hypothetical protein
LFEGLHYVEVSLSIAKVYCSFFFVCVRDKACFYLVFFCNKFIDVWSQVAALDGEEDASTVEAHIAVMQREMSSRSRDMAVVSDRTSRTFVCRRETVGQLTTAEIIDKFPALTVPSQVILQP